MSEFPIEKKSQRKVSSIIEYYTLLRSKVALALEKNKQKIMEDIEEEKQNVVDMNKDTEIEDKEQIKLPRSLRDKQELEKLIIEEGSKKNGRY